MYITSENLPISYAVRLPNEQSVSVTHDDAVASFRALKTAYESTKLAVQTKNDEDVIKLLDGSTRKFASTDIRFSGSLPKFDSRAFTSLSFNEEHPHEPHTHKYNAEKFSWCITTDDDDAEFRRKKKLIHPVSNQRMCGSCWAVCMATTMSDCFVVSGTTDWPPYISPTYIMMKLPFVQNVQRQCKGGNPAKVALNLETTGVVDMSCIDYSWCDSDETCASGAASKHLEGNLGETLNEKIPKPAGCYFDGEKYEYVLDSGSNVYSIDEAGGNVDEFRRVIQAHVLDFGPTMGGYVVLKNFLSGAFTDECLNPGGVYLERGRYDDVGGFDELQFSDSEVDRVSGLHAVSIVGWGTEKNVRYDNDGSRADIPYWHCRNSWGDSWGHAKGFFKMAMYPYNKIAQFDKRLTAKAYGDIGSMVLVRACKFPTRRHFDPVEKTFVEKIKRERDDEFYRRKPEDVAKIFKSKAIENDGNCTTCLQRKLLFVGAWGIVAIVGILFVLLLSYLVYLLVAKRRQTYGTGGGLTRSLVI